MWQFCFFFRVRQRNSLFCSILRLPAMFGMTHHKPTKCLFLQCVQLVPANILGNKAFHFCNSISHYIFCELPEAKIATLYLKVPPTYIYICRRVIGLSTFFAFLKVNRLSAVFRKKKKIIFTAARSKMKVNRLATGELIGCPPQGSFFYP